MRLLLSSSCVALLCVSSCSRDLTLPPPVEGGTVYGVVVFALPGGGYGPAGGAQVGLMGASISTTAGSDGAFFLDGVEVTRGRLLFRHGDGATAKQRLMRIEDIHAGPGRQIGLGQVVLSENGTLYGRVLLEDRASSRGGHSGTRVFVPESPYQGITADDGSFELTGLPEGTLALAAFHVGYQPIPLGEITLRGGERFGTSDLVLRRDPSTTPGALHGMVRLDPPSDATISVSATDSAGTLHPATVQAAGYQVSGLTPDVYSVQLAAPGYQTATVQNVPVSAGLDVALADVVLGPGGQIDAGFVEVDAGCSRCGSSCATSLDCPANQWCDSTLCRPLCGSAADCGAGRACDALTQTCVTPCTGGCALGFLCDLNRNACTPACDLSIPCPTGLKCGAAGLCVPDCLTAADCGAHQSCRAGLCANDGTCSADPDCPASQICVAGQCVTRSATPLDGGGFACGAPCDCKMGEACLGGQCLSDVAPTAFAMVDGDGGGFTPLTASRDLQGLAARGGTIALLGSDTWSLDGGLALDGGVSFIGGYVACNPSRWVRDADARTSITAPGTVFTVARANTRLQSLALHGAQATACEALVRGSVLTNLELIDLELDADPPHPNCDRDLIRCDDCSVHVDGLVMTGQTPQPAGRTTRALHAYRGEGEVRGIATRNLATQNVINAAWFEAPVGPVRLYENHFDPGRTWSFPRSLAASNCGTSPLVIEQNQLSWGGIGTNGARLIDVVNCPNTTVRDNLVGTAPVTGWTGGGGSAIYLESSGGVVSNNTVSLPDLGPATGTLSGLEIQSVAAPLTVSGNVIDGGVAFSLYGISISQPARGPVLLERNEVTVRGPSARALFVNVAAPAAGLRVRDNQFVSQGVGSCGGNVIGMDLVGDLAGVFERNLVRASNGNAVTSAIALFARGKQLELYDNALWTGAPSGPPCGAGAARGISMSWFFTGDVVSGQLYAAGNTFVTEGDSFTASAAPIDCSGDISLVFDSNLIGGARAQSSYLLKGSGPNCYVASNWTKNYFWRTSDGGVPADEASPFLFDAGVSTSNVNGGNVSCLDPTAVTAPWRIAAGSACVDQGSALQRDGGMRATDFEGQARTRGSAADIGCFER